MAEDRDAGRQLTRWQQAAVNLDAGRHVVIAGPGSGKTEVAIRRIARMIDGGEPPSAFVAVTFTNRAAEEFEQRLGRRLGFCGTFHALARYVLEMIGPKSGLRPGFSVWDEHDKRLVIEDVIETHRLKTTAAAVLRAMGREFGGHHIVTAIARYRERKAHANAEDFDGLMQRATHALVSNPSVLLQLRNRWRHWTVDEAQDMDGTQARLFDLIRPDTATHALTDTSTFVIGDPMQALYRWRGADPAKMIELAEHANTVTTLADNFRSGKAILDGVNHVGEVATSYGLFGNDRLRVRVDHVALVQYRRSLNEENERDWIVGDILDRCYCPVCVSGRRCTCDRSTTSLKDIAVLARDNATLEWFARAFDKRGIPYRLAGARRSRLQSPAARAVIHAIRLALNPDDDLAARHALAFFLHPGGEAIDKWIADAKGSRLFERIEHLAGTSPTFAYELASLRADLGRMSVGRDDPSGWQPPLGGLIVRAGALVGHEHAEELLDAVKAFRHREAEGRSQSLSELLWWLLFGQGANEIDPEADEVVLSTVHLAKGLEWREVYVVGLVEGRFPTSQAVRADAIGNDPEAMLDERRAFYVATSRAQRRLVLCWFEEEGRQERTRSRFVDVFRGGALHCGEPGEKP